MSSGLSMGTAEKARVQPNATVVRMTATMARHAKLVGADNGQLGQGSIELMPSATGRPVSKIKTMSASTSALFTVGWTLAQERRFEGHVGSYHRGAR